MPPSPPPAASERFNEPETLGDAHHEFNPWDDHPYGLEDAGTMGMDSGYSHIEGGGAPSGYASFGDDEDKHHTSSSRKHHRHEKEKERRGDKEKREKRRDKH